MYVVLVRCVRCVGGGWVTWWGVGVGGGRGGEMVRSRVVDCRAVEWGWWR